MDIFFLYMFTRLTALNGLFFGITMLSVFSALMMFMFSSDSSGNEKVDWGKRSKKAAVIAAISVIVFVALPTQKDAAIILAGSAILNVAKSETAGRLASKSVQLIEQTLDGYLKKDAK